MRLIDVDHQWLAVYHLVDQVTLYDADLVSIELERVEKGETEQLDERFVGEREKEQATARQ